MRDDVYLRGSVVTWYSQNHWRRDSAADSLGTRSSTVSGGRIARPVRGRQQPGDAAFRIGPPVVQQITMEPYLDRDDRVLHLAALEPVGDETALLRSANRPTAAGARDFSGEPRRDNFKCEVRTSGLVDGHQAPLIPASREVRVSPYLQMPGDPSPLPRLTALAARWLQESGLPLHEHYEVARWFEQQLSSSGQFQYSLQGPERDTSIDAIEDFVSNNPRGHCEYFATALALMLRSQGIPSRVVLGYRCDEWHEDQQCYQVRQLHAHAWVEAFLDRDQIASPQTLRRSEPIRWTHGGWLRLDPTPAGEVGTQAAERTMWGAWQGRWHGLQRSWDKYIVDMDRKKQRESVYEPISRATRNLTSKVFNPHWWRELAAGLWASLAAMFRSGIMGWLFGVVVLIAIVIVPVTLGWWLARRLAWLWRRLSGNGVRGRPGAEFDRVLPPLRADCRPLRLAARRRADAPRVRPCCRCSAGRGQRAARAVRAGHAGGRGLLQCPLWPPRLDASAAANRAAGLGGIDGRRRNTALIGGSWPVDSMLPACRWIRTFIATMVPKDLLLFEGLLT